MEREQELTGSSMSDEIEIDLYELAVTLLRKWKLILLGLFAGILLAGIYTWLIVKPTYEASSMIYMRGAGNTIASLQDLQIGAELTNDYEVIFKSRPILQEVVEELELEMNYKELRNQVMLENPADTRILKVTVRGHDSKQASDIVNCLVGVAMDSVKEIDAKEPYLVEEAIVDRDSVSPVPGKNLMVGGILGCLVSMGIVTLLYVLNDKVCSLEEIEQLLDVAVIGSVPESSRWANERRN